MKICLRRYVLIAGQVGRRGGTEKRESSRGDHPKDIYDDNNTRTGVLFWRKKHNEKTLDYTRQLIAQKHKRVLAGR
jgi:hypothetical protein